MSVQVPNGVVDLLVPDEAAAVAAARRYLSYFGTLRADVQVKHADQRVLRHLIPENQFARDQGAEPVVIEALIRIPDQEYEDLDAVVIEVIEV